MTKTSLIKLATSAAVVAALGLASTASGQTAADAHWRPWIGCWVPSATTESAPLPTPGTVEESIICVRPVAGNSAVAITTSANNAVTDSTILEADGKQHGTSRDGCEGWTSAEWSKHATRVYVRSELTCAGKGKRVSNGMVAMTPNGEWLDVEGLSSADEKGVRVVHYSRILDSASNPAAAPAAPPFSQVWHAPAISAAEMPLTLDDVAEASQHLDSDVVQAWLVQLNQRFRGVDAEQLERLRKAGVAGSVTDLIVAMGYPEYFSINSASDSAQMRNLDSLRRAHDRQAYDESPYLYDPYWWPYGYSPYGFYYGYGYGQYRYGYGGVPIYGHYYPISGGGGPIYVVKSSSSPIIRAIHGLGYTSGSSSGQASSGDRGSSGSSGSSGSGSSGSSGSSGGSSSSGSSSGGSSTGRTAIPRPPGGGGN